MLSKKAVLAENFGINRDKCVHSPKKLRSSDIFEGGNASRKTAVSSGSGLTHAEDKITPKKFNSFCKNKHFS